MSVRHGTKSGYTHHGCRCSACREAKRLFQREQRAGVRRPLVDAGPTRDRILALRAEGWSYSALARLTGYHHTVLSAIARGESRRVRQATAEDIASARVGEVAA